MSDDVKTAGVVNEGIARNTGGLLIILGETSVDNDQLALRLDRVLAVDLFNGDMAVDDDGTIGIVDAELVEDADRKILGVLVLIVRARRWSSYPCQTAGSRDRTRDTT